MSKRGYNGLDGSSGNIDRLEIFMAIIAGIDGCKLGWLCISRDFSAGVVDSAVYADAEKLVQQEPLPDIIAVDIPIGLTSSGYRQCDVDARKLLGKRKSSVFPAPIRPVLGLSSYSQANALHKEITGKGMSKQSYAICRKIFEFDQLLVKSPSLQQRVKEVHPEVSFWAWNNHQPIAYNKKKSEGRKIRREMIEEYFGTEVLDEVRCKYARKNVADDDIHDSFAALWTAERILTNKARRLPETPVVDEKGLYMEIWY